jgi:Tol biopolymer transport system component
VAEAASDEIDRVSSAGGAAQQVLEGGRAATVSPNGKKIAYLRLDFKLYRSSLWVADTDGSHPKQLVDQDTFVQIQGARFSPDSRTLVFAASGVPQKQLPGLIQAQHAQRHSPIPDWPCQILSPAGSTQLMRMDCPGICGWSIWMGPSLSN